MLKPSYPYYVANEPVAANQDLEVYDKFSGDLATRVVPCNGGGPGGWAYYAAGGVFYANTQTVTENSF